MSNWQEARLQVCNVCGVRMYHPKGERVSCIVCEALKARWQIIDAQVLTNRLTGLLDSASAVRQEPDRTGSDAPGVGHTSTTSYPQPVDK